MAAQQASDLIDPTTPAEVIIRSEARQPVTDPTLGVKVSPADGLPAKHRLVVLGDSLTQGFQNFAIFKTDVSYPAMIAHELGWYNAFRHPHYEGYGGLPLNLEYLARQLDAYGSRLSGWDMTAAAIRVTTLLDAIRTYWEKGPGSYIPATQGIMHNLAVSGFTINDLLTTTADTERAAMTPCNDPFWPTLVHDAGPLIARYVLESARDAAGRALTPVEAAQTLGEDGGIETLIVFIGSNEALHTVLDLQVNWEGKEQNILLPSQFKIRLEALQSAVRQINARHVIWCTVPHVTIAPITRGVGNKVQIRSRYFPYYVRPWIDDADLNNPSVPHLTAAQALAIDSAIDMYNDDIAALVETARRDILARDWLLLDVAGLLDRMATRRYIDDPSARPSWWTPYEFPAAIQALNPPLNSRFLACDSSGRTDGGIFSLDGVHPTTIIYAVLAQEFMNIMQQAGVVFYQADGVTPRPQPVCIDFNQAIAQDTLISQPPRSISSDINLVGHIDKLIDWIKYLSTEL